VLCLFIKEELEISTNDLGTRPNGKEKLLFSDTSKKQKLETKTHYS